jgi:LysM repeat protein
MISNCDAFYKVVSGDTCEKIVKANGISMAQFTQWNTGVGDTCTGLWLDAYVCISVVGHTPTPTGGGNGIPTPTPIQDGMTTSCKTFHFVQSGDTCDSMARKYGTTVANLIKWNPAAGSTCTGLWANTYACVAVL